MSIKNRFLIWLAVITLISLLLLKNFYTGIQLNTNILDLLPKTEKNSTIDEAINRFSNTMGKQLVFLIGNKDRIAAQQAADQFFAAIKTTPLLQKITYLIDADEQQAWGTLYFPYRLSLLAPTQKNLLLHHNPQQIQQNAILDLYSPLGISNAALLQHDPFFLFRHFLMSLPKPANRIALQNQRMTATDGGNSYLLLNATLIDDSFSITNQEKILALLQKTKAKILATFPDTQILMNGMLFYAQAGAAGAEHDIATIGVGSLIGIILLCVLAFGSLLPLAWTLLSTLVGFIAAFLVTTWIFGKVHLFTLILGSSLIGICVDYAFFYYADRLLGKESWTPKQGLKNIFPGISLGLLNIILAYGVLAFMPFPGLQQLAIFAITGLIMAYATVVCAFPMLPTPKPYLGKKNRFLWLTKNISPLLWCSNKYLAFCSQLSFKKILIIYSIITIIFITGICQLKIDDDIHTLQTIPTTLTQTEKQLKKIIGSDLGMDFCVVTGNTPEQTLNNEQLLTRYIDNIFPEIKNRYMAISSYLPGIAEQTENFGLVKNLLINNQLINYLRKIGVKKATALAIHQTLATTPFVPLTIAAWQQSSASNTMRFLWLGKINNQFISIVLLSSKLTPAKLTTINQKFSFITYVNKAKDVSKIFQTYREKTLLALLIIYGILSIILISRYPIKNFFGYVLPPIYANALSLGIMGWLAIPLTLFNTLALILVLGIAVDYIVFFAETKSSYQSTMLATALSAIATMLSFGLLIFSNTPVLSSFGLTVLTGIGSAFFLTPLTVLSRNTKISTSQ